MELAEEVKTDLQNSTTAEVKTHLSSILECLVNGETCNENILADKKFCSLQILVVEAVRNYLNQEELEASLDNLNLGTQKKTVIKDFLTEHKLTLGQKLRNIGTFLPQVVDGRWKLECVTQVSALIHSFSWGILNWSCKTEGRIHK